jgi:hypothetical protein
MSAKKFSLYLKQVSRSQATKVDYRAHAMINALRAAVGGSEASGRPSDILV